MMRSRLFEANAGQSFLAGRQFSRWTGTVTQAVGLLIESIGSMAAWAISHHSRGGGRVTGAARFVRYRHGTLDGSIATQLEEIEAGWWTGFEERFMMRSVVEECRPELSRRPPVQPLDGTLTRAVGLLIESISSIAAMAIVVPFAWRRTGRWRGRPTV